MKQKHPYYGVPRVHAVLRRRGRVVNRKAVHRLMRILRLCVLRKTKVRRCGHKQKEFAPVAYLPGDVWGMDFVFNRLKDGSPYRCFTIVDLCTRESPGCLLGRSMSGTGLTAYLDRLKHEAALPKSFILDNGSEFVNSIFLGWCAKNAINVHFIDPGKPVQNAYIESFNGKFRTEFLNQHHFSTLAEARRKLERWLKHYNEERPHSSLDYQTPKEFADQYRPVLRA